MYYWKLIQGWGLFGLGSITLLTMAWMVETAPRPQPEPTPPMTPNTQTQPQPQPEVPDTITLTVTESVSPSSDTESSGVIPLPLAQPNPNPTGESSTKETVDQQTVIQPEPTPPADEPNSAVPVEAETAETRLTCDFLQDPPAHEPGYNNGYAWPVAKDTPMNAVFSGSIVKISQSPYTGTTVYQVNQTGTWCAVYGGVGELLFTEGDPVPCGTQIGLSSERVYLSAMTLKVGESWWRGKPASIKALFK